ncbi:50S ribosome-binding GTPase [Candidatus Woesearchaeota archaeon]|nr:50S ribosome-binding GTPase [Candidatus Woesearchaeota archaeon]
MERNYWAVANSVISEADIILEIIDARAVSKTRNLEIEAEVRKAGKLLIYVLNKCDLADQKELEQVKKTLSPSVFISCKDYHGMSLLTDRIIIEAKRKGIEKPIVGVIGYPNMGKSSVINALTGTGKARTSSVSGFTRGKQYINSRHFYLIDTPGIIPYNQKDVAKDMMTGIKTGSKDPESEVLLVMESHPGVIEKYFDLSNEEDKEETLEKIAMKMKYIRKGNLPDTTRAARTIISLLREGKIRIQLKP